MLFFFLGCLGGGDTGQLTCSDAPDVDYHNFGDAFLRHNCQGCHASAAENRYGAPEFVTFDTVAEAWNWSERILASAGGVETTMPPAGSVSEDDKVLLYWWLECGREGE